MNSVSMVRFLKKNHEFLSMLVTIFVAYWESSGNSAQFRELSLKDGSHNHADSILDSQSNI